MTSFDEAAPHVLSLKCAPEVFGELIEQEDIVPAPYMARASWVAFSRWDALPSSEMKRLIADSYRLIREKLPKKTQAQIGEAPARKIRRGA